MLPVGLRVAEELLECSKPVDRGIGGGVHFLSPPLDHQSGALFHGLEVFERNELWISIEGSPQEMLVEVHFGQHDLPVRLAGSSLGEPFEDATQEVAERKECVSVVGSFL